MGIYDRDHRQNDPWKKNESKKFKLKFNEAKGEMELDDSVSYSTNKNYDKYASANKKQDIYDSGIRRKTVENDMKNDIKKYNEAARAKRKIKPEKSQSPSSFSFIPWIITLVIIVFVAKIINKPYSSSDTSSVTKQTKSATPTIITPVTPPTSTLFTSYNNASATCPLTLIVNNRNYYVKLCDTMRGDKTVAKFFIRAKDELTVKVPAGNYKIKFGSGNEWHGEQELFGLYGEYGELKELNFNFDGYSSHGHTISFYKTVTGNLRTDGVTRNYIAKD